MNAVPNAISKYLRLCKLDTYNIITSIERTVFCDSIEEEGMANDRGES